MSAIQQAQDLAAGLEGAKGRVSLSPAVATACGGAKAFKDSEELSGGGLVVNAADLCKIAPTLEEPAKKKKTLKTAKGNPGGPQDGGRTATENS